MPSRFDADSNVSIPKFSDTRIIDSSVFKLKLNIPFSISTFLSNSRSLLNNFKMPILTTMIRKKIFSKYRFENKYNIIGDFDLFIRISLKEKIFSIQEPLAFYRIHDSNMTTSKIDINIQELENWFYKYSKKKYFKKYNFLKVKKIIQTLKVKKYFISGKIIKALSELFKSPFNFYNLKYVYFLILPENLIKKL